MGINMARASNKLTDTWLKRSKIDNGIYGDGDGLYLRVQGSGRSWVYIYAGAGGKRREMGLGAYPSVGLADARGRADAARKIRATGGDPIEARDAAKEAAALALVREAEAQAREQEQAELTAFANVAEQFVRAKEKGWTHDIATKYRGYIRNHLGTLSSVSCCDLTTLSICEALRPIWDTPTGPFVRSFVERILDYAMVSGICPERLNPARIDAVKHVLHDRDYEGEHHAAMPYADVPAFAKALRSTPGYVQPALLFAILTASRQREVREMTWREVDLDAALWVIPKARYKTRVDHRVPLSKAAVDLLKGIVSNREPDALVFAGRLKGRPMSQHAFATLIPEPFKAHGFRTSFVGWATRPGSTFTDDMAQRCLGHLIGTAVTRAYDRDDRLPQRREMMDAWADYLLPSA
ncbi:site-specific integrase [Mesorhizobium sp. M2A.F.Ca.ET.043.05.1.1]|uniref:tyrosine-type recombinase/integrase n=1 Tax=Mesorhizobium sp. M2A.F.Ca.ET.043.05.1.1 TaxID=2493671 RepID=UPI0016727013|nr:site-specific integrase [Mesorhizobium sp. M2A.F.Ca.ET.043.05.1.1]